MFKFFQNKFANTQMNFFARYFPNKYLKEDKDGNLLPEIFYHGTTCCAMGMLSAQNFHSFEELENVVETIKKNSTENEFSPESRDGGERTLLCVTTHHEKELENNLKKLGFKVVATMPRRRGYPKGTLKLHLLSF